MYWITVITGLMYDLHRVLLFRLKALPNENGLWSKALI